MATVFSAANSDGRESDLLTPAEAAAFLRVKVQTLAVWRATARYGLPFFKIGRSVFYLRADLIAWRDSRRRIATD